MAKKDNAQVDVRYAARRLWWPWLGVVVIGAFWLLSDSPFSLPRRIAYLSSAILPLFGALGAMLFGQNQATRRIPRADFQLTFALSSVYMFLVILIPLALQLKANQKPDFGALPAGTSSLRAEERPASSEADRNLDQLWPFLSIIMGFTVFAHGRIIGKQADS